MAEIVITEKLKKELAAYLKSHRKNELVTTYLYYLERKYNVQPVVFINERMIYESSDAVIKKLEDEGLLWRETEIKIRYGKSEVNEETKKIYICPFSGKVFGDNTHPNPQDAIYDWVSTCPENTERNEGLRVKRFFVADDPGIIKNYITNKRKTVTKKVFSSIYSNKLYSTKKAVLDDFMKTYLKGIALTEVQNQNRYEIDTGFLTFFQKHLSEDKITAFIDALSSHDVFENYINRWLEAAEEE